MSAIVVENLEKRFLAPVSSSKAGFYHRIKNYVAPSYQSILAVNHISFSLSAGERVAFIGPNGAGKSTTLKILAGIMQPTQGRVEILGKIPGKTRALAFEIGAVFGQRSQLWFHLPVCETFDLLAAIYNVPNLEYQKRLKELTDAFCISDLLKQPVRQLSLGERMRCEIVASFLHKPKILFLDEPTIGLDITAKAIIRDLALQQSKQEGVTLLLTSHDTDDIESVCDRVIILDRGKILLDDSLKNLKTRYVRKKVITIVSEESEITWNKPGAKILERSAYHLKLEIDLIQLRVEQVVSEILAQHAIKDLTIEDPSLETIIEMLYQHGAVSQ